MNLGSHEWHCPRPGCKYFITCYTEGGMRSLSEMHTDQHYREDRAAGARSTAIVLGLPIKDYGVLKMTTQDMAFLKTRHIKIDDKIEHDECLEPKPTTAELSQRQWARVLERTWNR